MSRHVLTLWICLGSLAVYGQQFYFDQFGGEHRKKFKYRNLKETILSIQNESMSQQRAIMDQIIEDWRGDLDQLDDILVIGRRF